MSDKKQIFDADGTDAVSRVLLELLNSFPLLNGKAILFSTLSESSGIGFFPTSGAALLSSTEDVTGHVRQVCLYPFDIVYRHAPKSEEQRLRVKELLDTLGKWLERQPVNIAGKSERLERYPDLGSGNRVIKLISRTCSGHLGAAYQDGTEDWTLYATLRYENEFDK